MSLLDRHSEITKTCQGWITEDAGIRPGKGVGLYRLRPQAGDMCVLQRQGYKAEDWCVEVGAQAGDHWPP